ncbi:hypothetical protein [Agriterribacter sp.]|uniref:hypothetical protein n=1 Tax=Agriterribacter sp. TaxID=2821509 RepID=UPI002C5EE4BE|nr:hypothetical protein [Agriterribacter sp.]HTN07842.1 hypothetical protein [Agriterribacter sp.]
MKKIVALAASFIFFASLKVHAQGCVAVRSTGGVCMLGASHDTVKTNWELYANNRYFRSYRHFVGTKEQKQRVEAGTEVINHSYSLDLTLLRQLHNGWSLGFNLPVNANIRSSMYEHGGNGGGADARHKTHSFGVGDIRLTVYKWLLDPATAKANVQVGLGIKLPTGDYKYQDYFIKNDSTRLLGPVDQSIQLGDGGTGFTTELNAYYNISHKIGLYGNVYYLFNPREQNGVSTSRGGATSATSLLYRSDVMSVPDQYMLRAGVNVNFNKLTISAGVRNECVPARDVIGGSNGFRRPGYIISAEPGLQYHIRRGMLYAFVPVAIVRDRTQSVPDKIRTAVTGTYAKGDAAFADYLVNVGVAIQF